MTIKKKKKMTGVRVQLVKRPPFMRHQDGYKMGNMRNQRIGVDSVDEITLSICDHAHSRQLIKFGGDHQKKKMVGVRVWAPG